MPAISVKIGNSLDEWTRTRQAESLQIHLAAALDLKLQAKQLHWNVKGPNFFSLHQLFDRVAEELEAHSDTLAERAVQLAGSVEGAALQASSKLPPVPSGPIPGPQAVEHLSLVLGQFGQRVREASEQAASSGDADTADIFTEVSRGVDKLLWFVEAHAQ
ncbi:MAG: DNA starvation/stationary phase protection protein [Candidatus Xenobia bacterium]|jgi:starvation-inducible DNA-binding protein